MSFYYDQGYYSGLAMCGLLKEAADAPIPDKDLLEPAAPETPKETAPKKKTRSTKKPSSTTRKTTSRSAVPSPSFLRKVWDKGKWGLLGGLGLGALGLGGGAYMAYRAAQEPSGISSQPMQYAQY